MARVTINNVIDLYDIYIPELLKNRMDSIPDAKFIYCPSDLAFSFAQEKFGEKIFPLYSIFRNEPFQMSEQGSLANYRSPYTLSNNKSMNYLNITLDYQIDFYSNDLHQMNIVNTDYWKKLRRNPHLDFNFSEVGLEDIVFQSQILFPADIESNNNITNMFQSGRFFRYTWYISLNAIDFEVNTEIEAEKFIFSIYEKKDQTFLLKNLEVQV